MFVVRKLTLTSHALAVFSLSISLTSCSVIPFPPSWTAAEDEAAPQQKTTAQLPKILPPRSVSAPTAQPATARLTTTEIEKLAQQAKVTKTKLPANTQEADLEDETILAGKSSIKGKNAAQIAAQNLIKGRKNPTKTARSNEDETNFIPNAPKTYRIDGPQQMANNMPPEAYQQQNYYNPNQGGYPRNPAQFQYPQNMGQGNGQTGFMPPDPSPMAQKPTTDPKAVMEAIERMRTKQAVLPNPQMEQPTGTLAQSSNQGDPQPKTPLTFVQFERSSITLTPTGQKSISSMLAPHARVKKAKIYLTAGLGGEGEAYTKLLQANQRAQAVSDRIPSQFEVIRRFDPSLPNESVRLFVVE